MAFATARTLALRGADGHVIDVQVDASPGVPATTLVGRGDKSLSDLVRGRHRQLARCRVRAVVSLGLDVRST
jgi:hypothetical protein